MRDSEFEELEAVPTSSAIDGPLEPPPSSTAVVSDASDESFPSYFSVSYLGTLSLFHSNLFFTLSCDSTYLQ